MAARITTRQATLVREKIRVTLLIKRLEEHVLDGTEMSQSQIMAARTLLAKCLPDLSSVEHSGETTHRHVGELSRDELLRIASGSSAGDSEAGRSGVEPAGIH